jgi:uncharacterized protein (TIGR00288 family)
MGSGDAPHAALLIDFDNVTMGMRSDLSKELKHLLDSDVIKGKVSVQRAYADWRRYPQYIVPLSEASVDLIFAPAYGSSKKNATDIRMAIDALELIFIRPEIGTYILLTGDSDFSSLVLKLKEYGKYVIGVGIQESSSDILVQNCDEYYSYTSLTGLTKTTELTRTSSDPWVLVKDAVAKMESRGDVMRSDRLKQVMQEIDSNFDEGAIGFSKFSKCLAEASSRGLVELRKLENGQLEVARGGGGGGGGSRRDRDEGRGRRERGRSGRGRERGRSRGGEASDGSGTDGAEVSETSGDPLQDAYGTLRAALEAFRDGGRLAVRDADVKRRMLDLSSGFDEGDLGFPKFSKFLAQAEEHGVIRLSRTPNGDLDVTLAGDVSEAPEAAPDSPTADAAPQEERTVVDVTPPSTPSGVLGPRRGSTRSRVDEERPSLLGRLFGVGTTPKPAPSEPAAPAAEPQRAPSAAPEVADAAPAPEEPVVVEAGSVAGGDAGVDLSKLGLPSDHGAIVRYLTHRYKGVGEKTAETLVDRLGDRVFEVMHRSPDEIARIIPPKRAEQVLEAWKADYERRATRTPQRD